VHCIRGMSSEHPTMPPASADARADEFAARLARLEATQPRTKSGMFRVLAEAWAHMKESER